MLPDMRILDNAEVTVKLLPAPKNMSKLWKLALNWPTLDKL